ncbi:hypothetical protein CF319_g9108 [Tilletia indica]|nr:hypothetical protein CF319_g9108 [Tilletia indica]
MRASQEFAGFHNRLRKDLDAAADHVCVTSPSPRPYGALLRELRDHTQDPSPTVLLQPPVSNTFATAMRTELSPPPPSADFLTNSDALFSTATPLSPPLRISTPTSKVQAVHRHTTPATVGSSSSAESVLASVSTSVLSPESDQSSSAECHDDGTISSTAAKDVLLAR